MADTFIGTYTAQNGKTYDYAAFCHRRGNTMDWKAKVRLAAELVGEPSGTIDNVPAAFDVTPQVRTLIESSIEERIAVQ